MKASRILIITTAIIAVALGGAYSYAMSQKPLLELGVGYGARVACGCRYIGNRPIGDCYKDFEPGMEIIQLSDDVKTKTVTAYVPLLTSRSARFDPGLGCQPEALKR
jgi:hypothetical protein